MGIMGIMERITGKNKSPVPVVESKDDGSGDLHKKYEDAISAVLLREMGNNLKMQQVKTRIMLAIKDI